MKGNYKHGQRHNRIYNVWRSMRQRCNNPRTNRYKNYGGRGVSVCEEWNKFERFFEWAMESGYRDDLTIDRINIDGNYEPSNCRWVSYKEQANNKTNNRLLSLNGVCHTMSEWADITGIKVGTIWARLNSGWTVEKTLTKNAVVGANQYGR